MELADCSVTRLISTLIFGPNLFHRFAQTVDLYAGIPLFAGLVACDTNKTIEKYNNKDPDHLGCSIELYLDAMNILLRLIELINRDKNDRSR